VQYFYYKSAVDDYPGNLRGLGLEVTAGESGDISLPYLCIYEKT